MTTQKTLAFGFDGIVANVAPHMAAMVCALTGRACSEADWHVYDYFMQLTLSTEQFYDGLLAHRVLENADVYPGAIGAIARAQAAGFATAVVTSKGFHPAAHDVTQALLRAHGVDVDYLVVVPPGHSKVAALASVPNVVAYSDAHAEYLSDLRESGVDCDLFLVTRPWNARASDFERVQGLEEFVVQAVAAN